jgi:hypothetical protein
MIGEVKTLHPVFKLAVDQILTGMRARGWDPVIGSGMRTNEQQDALYAQGRGKLSDVNTQRRSAGLSPISAADNSHPVTNARGGQSNHNKTHSLLPYGCDAVDDAVGYAVDKKFWDDLGTLAKQNGCLWGGDWKKPDVAHVEMKLFDRPPSTSVVI